MLMWTALAYAEGEGAQQGGQSLLVSLIPFILIIFIFYFLLIRPQAKERKRHQAMLADLKKGDRVTAAGGIIGTVTGVDDDTATLQVADNVRLRVLKSSVTGLRKED